MAIALLSILAVVIAFLVSKYLKYRRFNKLLSKLPSPPGWWTDLHKFSDPSKTITNYLIEYDGMVLLRRGPTISYFAVADDSLVEILCTSKNVIKSPIYRLFERWLGHGLFTAEHETWNKYRTLVTPAFHSEILQRFVVTFNSVGDIMADQMKQKIGEQIDIYGYTNLCALDVIAETVMGVPVNALIKSHSPYVNHLSEILTVIGRRSLSIWKIHDWLYRLTNDYSVEVNALKVLNKFTNSVIEKRVRMKSEKVDPGSDDPIKKKRLALLDLLLETRTVRGVALTNQEISDLVEGFTFAGHDTTAIATACTFYLISQHPDVQRLVFEELREVFGHNKERHATYKDLQQLKYLEMVIYESMRLYPPAPLISKQLLEDIEYNGLVLPKGLVVLIMIRSMHRMEKYFPNPERFDPERFNQERRTTITPYSYIPFAAGHRNCIGQKFAMMEMKVIISKILRNYELFPIPDYELKLAPLMVQKPINGVLIQIKQRRY